SPSPFAHHLLFGYVGAFLYEGDAPLAERRAAALTLDPTLLAEVLGTTALRELLDPLDDERVEQLAQRTRGRGRRRPAATARTAHRRRARRAPRGRGG